MGNLVSCFHYDPEMRWKHTNTKTFGNLLQSEWSNAGRPGQCDFQTVPLGPDGTTGMAGVSGVDIMWVARKLVTRQGNDAHVTSAAVSAHLVQEILTNTIIGFYTKSTNSNGSSTAEEFSSSRSTCQQQSLDCVRSSAARTSNSFSSSFSYPRTSIELGTFGPDGALLEAGQVPGTAEENAQRRQVKHAFWVAPSLIICCFCVMICALGETVFAGFHPICWECETKSQIEKEWWSFKGTLCILFALLLGLFSLCAAGLSIFQLHSLPFDGCTEIGLQATVGCGFLLAFAAVGSILIVPFTGVVVLPGASALCLAVCISLYLLWRRVKRDTLIVIKEKALAAANNTTVDVQSASISTTPPKALTL